MRLRFTSSSRVPSYAKLYVAVKVMRTMRVLELVNASDEPAKSITLQLHHNGLDVSELVLGTVPASITPRGRAQLLLSSGPGPQDVEVTLTWTDRAGIPGQWMGPARRC